MRGGLLLLMVVISLGAPARAHAGRTFYGWMHGAEVMPERGAELQTWIGEENVIEDQADRSESLWGVGAFVGITDQLEVGFPLNVVWFKTPGMPGGTALHDYGIELRYRMVTQDPEEAPEFAPLVRVAVNRLVLARDVMNPVVDLVGAYESGSVHVQGEVGVSGEISLDDARFDLRAGAGASINAVGDLRFGAELFTQIALSDPPNPGMAMAPSPTRWLVIGPNLSWTHGRTWVSATYGIGIMGIKDAPRLQWGIAF